jgi:CPA1 family monovalent cation:H+ antiporter
MVVFILNGLIFILIGLQLPEVRSALSGHSILASMWSALLVVVGVILIRIGWVFAVTYLPRLMSRRFRKRDPSPPWRNVALVAWIGMRGADSLIAALAVPLWINDGSPFPDRDLIFFLTFSVILGTLVLQGLSLPYIIRWLKVVDDGSLEREERGARLKANQAALVRVNEIAELRSLHPDTAHRLRAEYEDRIRQLEMETTEPGGRARGLFSSEYEELAHEALMTERKAILQLRNERVINDDVLRRIQRDIDFAEARLKRPGNQTS